MRNLIAICIFIAGFSASFFIAVPYCYFFSIFAGMAAGCISDLGK